MELDPNINYIISGIERSGTSMLMQILNAGGLPVAFDRSRTSDENNPKGYYELEGGKIINKLMDGTFPLERYKGKFIKITAYGLKYLPLGNYKIIYSERNIEEILDSMEKMTGIKDKNREETKKAFVKLNDITKNKIQNRADTQVLLVSYNETILNPKDNIKKICEFLRLADIDMRNMMTVVDQKLYRQRRKK